MPIQQDDGPTGYAPRDRFITRVAIVVGAAALVFVMWQIRHALILVFAGVVVAVIVSAIADPLCRRLNARRGVAVIFSTFLILGLIGTFVWLGMPEFQAQGGELLSQLPDSLGELDRMLGSWLPEEAMTGGGFMGDLARRLASWSTTMVAAATTVVLVIVAGIFLATHPTEYRDGLVSLMTPGRQASLRHALDNAGRSLKAWLRAQLLSMLIVGLAVTGATWLLGLPSPFALGLIAGLLEFVPIIGPIAASVPALLLAMMISPAMVLWTALTYFAIEQVESNIILPFAQSEVADLPPALLIFAFVAIGSMFGVAGVIVSAPLTVALYSLTNDHYVKPLNRGSGQGT